jgi:catechol 2,3-dioxygenase-like lactoylglutathione lyase family enzyme
VLASRSHLGHDKALKEAPMINGAHVIVYCEDAEKARAFFRDTLKLPHVDAGRGWLIFAMPPSEVACHPSGPGEGAPSGSHELWFMCDDVQTTVAELKAKGVEFTQPVTDQGWGIVIRLKIPGGGEMGLYQPRHPVPR